MTEKLETGLWRFLYPDTQEQHGKPHNAAMLEYQSTASTDFLAQFRGMTYLQREKHLREILSWSIHPAKWTVTSQNRGK